MRGYSPMGVKHIHTHICGEQNLNLPHWSQVPMGEPGIISFGHEVDLDIASKYFPNDIIMGNVEPTVIQEGPPEEAYDLSRICIEKGKSILGALRWLRVVRCHPRRRRITYG